MRFENANLMDRNAEGKADCDAINAHCSVLQGQNKDLNVELERFVQTDEHIRETLNRRERIMGMQHAAEAEAARTAYEIARSRSPIRRR